ncbi:MAG TPA: Type 1 glutamine amidotransferase-like domain-containing protein [Pyrinomonadaceae bacterium]|nr:Type 1 glutamine amidotransferase-like domain-containing protein [Pyrinomonadaceae bacterium]
MISYDDSASFNEITPLKPIFLFADSELLFHRENGQLLLDRVVKEWNRDDLKAAYIGASNGDHPDFYTIFVAAMEGVGVSNCRMISSSLSEEDLAFLNDADIILLAGGDVEAGWRVFLANGVNEHIVRRYSEGASLIGISAGAVQLGLCCLGADGSLVETFALVPFVIGAHEESDNWRTTRELLRLSGSSKSAIGLPKGGGAVYHLDHTLEPLRYPFVKLGV